MEKQYNLVHLHSGRFTIDRSKRFIRLIRYHIQMFQIHSQYYLFMCICRRENVIHTDINMHIYCSINTLIGDVGQHC